MPLDSHEDPSVQQSRCGTFRSTSVVANAEIKEAARHLAERTSPDGNDKRRCLPNAIAARVVPAIK